jgi:hypothetical protein
MNIIGNPPDGFLGRAVIVRARAWRASARLLEKVRRALVSDVEFGWSSRADPHASLMAFFAGVFILV